MAKAASGPWRILIEEIHSFVGVFFVCYNCGKEIIY